MKKNVVFNYSLETYKKKYRHSRYKLLKFTKDEVSNFSKKKNSKDLNFLLNSRKWALIDNTYYEIPKAPRLVWFRNLNAATKAGVYTLVLGGALGGGGYGIKVAVDKTTSYKNEVANVNKINDVLAKHEGSFTYPKLAVDYLTENNIPIDEMSPKADYLEYGYNLKNNEVVLINKSTEQVKYSKSKIDKTSDVWRFRFKEEYATTKKSNNDTYGTYLRTAKELKVINTVTAKNSLATNFNSVENDETITFNSNIDVGNNKQYVLKFTASASEDSIPMVVTNHNDLIVNGNLKEISHYGHATSITVDSLDGTYFEYGTVDGDIIINGENKVKVEIKEEAKVNTIVVNNSSDDTQIVVPEKADVGTIVATEDSGANLDDIVQASEEKKKEIVEEEPIDPEEVKDFSGGLGTEKSPFTIDLANQLVKLSSLVADETEEYDTKSYKITADIDLTGKTVSPIGTLTRPFKGNFDGGNNTISNLTIDNDSRSEKFDSAALIGVVCGTDYNTNFDDVYDVFNFDTNVFDETDISSEYYKSKITNVNIENVSLKNTADVYNTGGVVGRAQNAYISNCHVKSGEIHGFNVVGGVVGEIICSVVKNCDTGSGLSIDATKYNLGGIVGVAHKNATTADKYGSAVIGCTNNAKVASLNTVSAGGYAGGIGGMFQSSKGLTVIENCVNNGEITTTATSGGASLSGILGQGNCNHLVSNSTNNGYIHANADVHIADASGICNYNSGYFYNDVNNGNISAFTTTSLCGVMAEFASQRAPVFGAVGCVNNGQLTCLNPDCRDIADIATGLGKMKLENMTFATTQDLANAITTALGSYSAVYLKNVTVTDHSGVLDLPNGINEITSDSPICSSIKLNSNFSHFVLNVPDVNITVDGDYNKVYLVSTGANNHVVINQGATIGTAIVGGANSSIINNGTVVNGIGINGAATYGENNEGATCSSVGFGHNTGGLTSCNKHFVNKGTIKSSAYNSNQHVIYSIGGTGKIEFDNYGTVEYELKDSTKAKGYLHLFYNSSEENNVFTNYDNAVIKTSIDKGYIFALKSNLTYRYKSTAKLIIAGVKKEFSSLSNPKVTLEQI